MFPPERTCAHCGEVDYHRLHDDAWRGHELPSGRVGHAFVRVPMKEKTCACGRTWLTRGGQEKCPPCRLVSGETIVPLLDPDHDEKTEPSDWNALTLDEEGFPF
jgi:hypothetical protein